MPDRAFRLDGLPGWMQLSSKREGGLEEVRGRVNASCLAASHF